MSQGIIGGATSYEEQSLIDILNDINNWIDYTSDRKAFILAHREELDIMNMVIPIKKNVGTGMNTETLNLK